MDTPSQGAMPHTGQGSLNEARRPRTSDSGNTSMTASTFNNITTSFQEVNFSPDPGPSHKRSASQAQLQEEPYHLRSSVPGPSGPLSSYDQLPDQSNFNGTAQQDFGEVYSEGGNSQFTNYASATPHLPLLSIPELSYTHENSPWCSSASDSTYSTQSEGPRGPRLWNQSLRGRSASIATLPDWQAQLWPSHGVNTTPQDLQSPSFDSFMDQYEAPSFASERTTPSSIRGHLDVPNSFGGYYIESVGTPALSTHNKPLAHHFSVSPPRMSDNGLASISRRQKNLVSGHVTMTTSTASPYQTRHTALTDSQLNKYISSYFQFFHTKFPIVHRLPTSDHNKDSLLKSAMAAIGTQYHNTPEARAKGVELNDFVRNNINIVSYPSPIR